MALFVQIDHFRKTDQKPTVKNHLFSISWFRSFNRTSFQQQLKLMDCPLTHLLSVLQSYILSTTTETSVVIFINPPKSCFNRTSFQQQLKHQCSSFQSLQSQLQSYILSTTTETTYSPEHLPPFGASIVHPFNNN